MKHEPDRDFPIAFVAMPINAAQRNTAIAVVAFIALATAATAPFAHLPVGRVDAFIPVLQTVICIAELITAMLLLSQYAVVSRPAILVLAAGYLASGIFAFLQTLAFPGGYAPAGVIGNGSESAGWFFVWWHLSFHITVVVYALLKDRPRSPKVSVRSAGIPIGVTLASTMLWIIALTLVATAGISYLPRLFSDSVTVAMPLANRINILFSAMCATAIVLIFLRRRSMLDLWLTVALLGWLPNFVVAALFPIHRFSLGWYTSRIFALIGGFTVLIALLAETIALYTRLANAVALLRQERDNRLMSLDAATGALAHEIRQPLTAVTSTSSAGLNWLKATPPDIEKIRHCLTAINNSGHRANEIIESVRGIFKNSGAKRHLIHLDEVALQVLDLMRQDLRRNDVAVAIQFAEGAPAIYADRMQLQQIILNLVKNAIEAMASSSPERRSLTVMTKLNGGNSVSLSIQDTGSGIDESIQQRVFDPFFTTKEAGMGLGLSISQTIARENGGRLQLVNTDSDGCLFELTFPVASARERSVENPAAN
jgi:signal transduction histidine kinase